MRTNIVFVVFAFCCFAFSVSIKAQEKQPGLSVALSASSQLTIEGPHRFTDIAGVKGLQVTSLKTKAFIETDAINEDAGTFSIWMSPLEDLGKSALKGKMRNGMSYPLISDHWPPRAADSSNFSVYYQGAGYPRVIARFTDGSFWGQMDFGIAPFVYAEELPLKKGQWYQFTVTWDKSAETLKMYINGVPVGHNYLAKSFKTSGSKLYIGNPLMVMSHLSVLPRVMNAGEVRKEYRRLRPVSNMPADSTVEAISTVQEMRPSQMRRDRSWEKVYACSFTDPAELKKWTLQTGDLYRDRFKLESTKDGLYWETPDIIHNESRACLWSPVNIEGDQWVEFEFQVLSPKGLALLMLYASGMQGEDVIDDHGLVQSGSMGDMLSNYRNYHWEYMRRVEAMRTDVETQYVNKNPWGKAMYIGCVPRFEQNRWYRLSCIRTGHRLVGLLDDKVVFDVTDDPYDNNGPVLNSGRVVLRQMYNTTMRYRNFVIYRKKQ